MTDFESPIIKGQLPEEFADMVITEEARHLGIRRQKALDKPDEASCLEYVDAVMASFHATPAPQETE